MAARQPLPPDPWAVSRQGSAVAPTRGGGTAAVVVLLSALAGGAGPAARLVSHDFGGRAAVLVAVVVVWATLWWHRRSFPGGTWIAAGVAALAPLLGWSTIGRAPLLVAFAGVVVAQGALAGWRPDPNTLREHLPDSGLAFVPVVASAVVWYRSGSILAVLALLATAVVLVEAHRRWPGTVGMLDRRLGSALVRLGHAVASVVLFVVVAVVLYLPGSVAAAVETLRRRRPRASFWSERTASSEDLRRDAARPFAAAPPRVRLLRHAGGLTVTAVAVLVVVGVSTGGDARGGLDDDEPRPDVIAREARVRFSELAAYRGVAFADELQTEQERFSNEYLLPSDVGGYDVADFAGRYTNVRDGARATVAPSPCSACPRATVWLVGGSTAFGLGQRDDATVASHLVRLAERHGTQLTVVNLGVPGWTIHQEAMKVEARLATDPAPDLVVFLDGYNDVVGTVIGATVRGVRPDEPSLLRSEDIRRFTEDHLDPREAAPPEELGELAARRYERVRERVDRLLEQRGIGSLHLFQPDALADESQYAAVQRVYRIDRALQGYLDTSLEVASERLSPGVRSLRHLLDDDPPVFVDLVHLNEEGARRVAEAAHVEVRAALGWTSG